MDHNPDTLKAAIAELCGLLKEWGWGEYPRDRFTVPYEDSMWAGLQNSAKAKYGQADPELKEGIKRYFDSWGEHRKFTAFDEERADSAEGARQRRSHSIEPGYVVGELRTDGLYRRAAWPVPTNDGTQESWSYLRFYADGTVLSVTSIGKEHQVANWFTKGHSGVGQGQYVRDGATITFSVQGAEYEGTVGVDELRLTSFRQNNGNCAEESYDFIAL